VSYLPSKGEAHFWLAEALRLSNQWSDAEPEYHRYLQLTDFDSGVGRKINYYVLGYLLGIGRKTRPTLVDIWRDQRNLAYFGLCDCERNMRRYDTAISYCQKSLTYDAHDPFAHYALAISFLGKFGASKDPGLLIAAREHFNTVIEINGDIEEATLARKDISLIDRVHIQ
jgi:tetratricopeptide (TPR) repeat protein